MNGSVDDALWPSQINRTREEFYAIRTAALLVNEYRWVHRRVEQFELIDERRARRHISVDFTLPHLRPLPWERKAGTWIVPLALLRRQLLIDLDVRGPDGAALPVLTREQNSRIAYELLRALARETLADAFGPLVEPLPPLLIELRDVVGCRRSRDDHPSDTERQRRTDRAIKRFRRAAQIASVRGTTTTRLGDQRQTLWRDPDMRGFLSTLADRFILLVPFDGSPGTRAIVKLSYEQALDVPPIVPAALRFSLRGLGQDLTGRISMDAALGWLTRALATVKYVALSSVRDILPFQRVISLQAPPPLFSWNLELIGLGWRLRETGRSIRLRTGKSFGLEPLSFRVPTRAAFGPESYHVEIAAPNELMIEVARLERVTSVVNLATAQERVDAICAAEDTHTERAHLYESLYTATHRTATPARIDEEVTVASAITVDFLLRPAFVLPSLLIGLVTSGMLGAGLLLHELGIPRQGDVTALLVVLPAVFAAYLIPGEHRLVRRMFRGVRSLVFVLSLVSFVAAGSLTLSFSSSARVTLWAVLFAIASASTATILAAYVFSTRRTRPNLAPESKVVTR